MDKKIAAIILAGGKGTRMMSDQAKVLHKLGGKPIVFYILSSLLQLNLRKITVVIYHQAEKVREEISKYFDVSFAYQEEALGTADALKAGIKNADADTRAVIVFNGDDSAFYRQDTIKKYLAQHLQKEAVVSIMGAISNTDKPLGRIFRDKRGSFEKLLEPNQYKDLKTLSPEINCGAYIFDYGWLKANIEKVPKNLQKGEYYITELPNMAKRQNKKVEIYTLKDISEWVGINTQQELLSANEMIKKNLSF